MSHQSERAIQKFRIYHGYRKPSQNGRTVRGGIFSNRIDQTSLKRIQKPSSEIPIDFRKWDPDVSSKSDQIRTESESFFSITRNLSPIARYICDSFRKNKKWGELVISDLNKLRRVTPNLVAEVLKVQTDPRISSKFFHWAGKQKGYRHNFTSYNAFTYCLNRNHQFRAADQVIELMNMQGKTPSEKQFEILIRMHSDAGRGLRVYFVYEKMKKYGIKPRVFLYNRVMDALVRTNHLDLALSVYEDFKEDGLMEETVTFMILVKGLCKAGRIDESLHILNCMRENLCKPDIFAYTAMIKVLVSETNLDGCLRVWDEMVKDGVEVDVMAYTTLITALCKGNNMEKAFELFKEMRGKKYLIDRAVYRSLIEGFVNNNRILEACELLRDLTELGYRADLSIYNSLIGGLCKLNWVDKAYKTFQIIVQEGLLPTFETVNPILISYVEKNRMDDFSKLLEKIHILGLSVKEILSKFFSCLVEKGGMELKALEVFKSLKIKEYCSIPIYNSLISGLYKIKERREALSLFNEMKDSEFEPDALTYSNVILCWIEERDLEEACSCYNIIKEKSWIPTIDAYSSLVNGLCKVGEIELALTLVRDCLANVTNGPFTFKYTLTILHVCKSSNSEKIVDVLNDMIQEGYPPDCLIYCAIIYGMCKYKHPDEAKKVFKDMTKRKLLSEANSIVYDEMLVEHLQKTAAGLVISGLKLFGQESKLKFLTRMSSLIPTAGLLQLQKRL